ncbi:uncharacterized protein TNCV_167471 [Trichonephila clavipes]|nr:uncharacterized protein TNCV_167471 [Trichonephila clavipes]
MDVCKNDLASLQHRSTDHYENGHSYVFFCGEGFCAILFVAAPHQLELQLINFSTVQSIAWLPTWLPKMRPTLLYHQHFAMFLLNRHYNPSRFFEPLSTKKFLSDAGTDPKVISGRPWPSASNSDPFCPSPS